MKEILLTEEQMVFLVLYCFHASLKVIILDGCFSRSLNRINDIKSRNASEKINRKEIKSSNKRIYCVSNNPKAVNPFLSIQTKTYMSVFLPFIQNIHKLHHIKM